MWPFRQSTRDIRKEQFYVQLKYWWALAVLNILANVTWGLAWEWALSIQTAKIGTWVLTMEWVLVWDTKVCAGSQFMHFYYWHPYRIFTTDNHFWIAMHYITMQITVASLIFFHFGCRCSCYTLSRKNKELNILAYEIYNRCFSSWTENNMIGKESFTATRPWTPTRRPMCYNYILHLLPPS